MSVFGGSSLHRFSMHVKPHEMLPSDNVSAEVVRSLASKLKHAPAPCISAAEEGVLSNCVALSAASASAMLTYSPRDHAKPSMAFSASRIGRKSFGGRGTQYCSHCYRSLFMISQGGMQDRLRCLPQSMAKLLLSARMTSRKASRRLS